MEKFIEKQKNTWILLIGALAVYFFMRFFFNITLPFLLAFLVIWKMYPLLAKISKKTKLKETWIFGILIFLLVLLLLGVLYVPVSNCFGSVENVKEDESILDICMNKYEEIRKICVKYVGEDVVIKIQSGAVKGVKSCISFFTYVIIFFVSMILFCKDFEIIREKIAERNDNLFIQVFKGVISYVKAFLKSQVIIFFVLICIISISLFILRVPNGFILGFLAGLLDAFPFVGTGIVLVPVSVWLFFKGRILEGFMCLFLYGVCALIRELLEPKLVGEKVGIYPIVLFASVFVGMQIYGVGGIIKGPLSVVIVYEIRKVLLAKEKKV